MKVKILKAILWDENKKINGKLILDKKRIQFRLADFGKTDLDIDLAYKEIKLVSFYNLYEHVSAAIEIIFDNNRSNIFVVEKQIELKRAIEVRCETMKELK